MSTKVTTEVPPPTENELALQVKQLELAEFQLTELQRQSELQQEFAGQIGPLLEQQTADAAFAREQAERLGPIQEELLTLALEDLRRGGEATSVSSGSSIAWVCPTHPRAWSGARLWPWCGIPSGTVR